MLKKLIVQLQYPGDEVGNKFVTPEQVMEKGVNPYSDVLSLEKYTELFGKTVHEFMSDDKTWGMDLTSMDKFEETVNKYLLDIKSGKDLL